MVELNYANIDLNGPITGSTTIRELMYRKTELLIGNVRTLGATSTKSKPILNYFKDVIAYDSTVSEATNMRNKYYALKDLEDEYVGENFDEYIRDYSEWKKYAAGAFKTYAESQKCDKYGEYLHNKVDVKTLVLGPSSISGLKSKISSYLIKLQGDGSNYDDYYLDKTLAEYFEGFEFLGDIGLLDYESWKQTAFEDADYLKSLKLYDIDGWTFSEIYKKACSIAKEQWMSYGNGASSSLDLEMIESEAWSIILSVWIDPAMNFTEEDVRSYFSAHHMTYSLVRMLILGDGTSTPEEIEESDNMSGEMLVSLIKIKMKEISGLKDPSNYKDWFYLPREYNISFKKYLENESVLTDPDLSDKGKELMWEWMTSKTLDGGVFKYLNITDGNTAAIETYLNEFNILVSKGANTTFGKIKEDYDNWKSCVFYDEAYRKTYYRDDIVDEEIKISDAYESAKTVAKRQWFNRNSTVDNSAIESEAERLLHRWVNADKTYDIQINGSDASKTVKEIREGHPSVESNEATSDTSDSSVEQTKKDDGEKENTNEKSGSRASGSTSSGGTDDRKYIQKSVDTFLGKMAYTFQIAQFMDLMPKPIDFVNKISEDVAFLSTRLIGITNKLTEISDAYMNIPMEYIMTNVNAMFDSATYVVNKTNEFASELTNQTLGVVSKTIDEASGLIDYVNDEIENLDGAITDVDGILVNLGNLANYRTTNVTSSVADAKVTSKEFLENMKDSIDEATGKVSEYGEKSVTAIDDAKNAVVKSIEWLRGLFDDLSESVDEFIGFNSIAETHKATLIESDETIDKVANNIAGSAMNVVSNFADKVSIVDLVRSLVGVATYATICAKGLDELPPIDFVSMLAPLRAYTTPFGEAEKSDEYKAIEKEVRAELAEARKVRDYKRRVKSYSRKSMEMQTADYNKEEAEYLREQLLSKSISEEEYDRKMAILRMDALDGYEAGVSEVDVKMEIAARLKQAELDKADAAQQVLAESKLQSKEDKARLKELKSKNADDLTEGDKDEIVSIEKRIAERKELCKVAKKAEGYKSELKNQLEYVGATCNDFAKKIQADWDASMKQYKTAIGEVSMFFKGIKTADTTEYAKSEGAKYISDCCGRIDKDLDDIVEQCKNIGVKLANSVLAIPVPTSIGPVVDMPVYKILCFFTEVKTIVKFIFDLVNDGADILIQVNNLANIMLNGFNSLEQVVEEILGVLNLDWILDLIDTIKELFNGKMLEGKALIENTISPCYFKDTEEYETLSDQLDSFLNPTDADGNEIEYTKGSKSTFTLTGYNDKNKEKEYTIKAKDIANDKMDDVEELEAALEQRGNNEISYYYSPIMNGDGTEIIGYHYYYNNVNKFFKGKIKRRFKNRIIKRAARTGNKEKGGVNYLTGKKLTYNNGVYKNRTGSAYDSFYWYTKYTNDPADYLADEKNQGVDTVGNIIATSNGSLVELENGKKVFVNSRNVTHGDVVTVDGIRYRVK